jgi:hypothetical protein
MTRISSRDMEMDELLRLCESGCWMAVLLFPLLYYLNGPAVSTDQLFVRAILLVFAFGAAVTLRICNRRKKR